MKLIFILGIIIFLLIDLFLEVKFLFLGFLGLKTLGQEIISSETNIMHYILYKNNIVKKYYLFTKNITHLEENNASYVLIDCTCWLVKQNHI